MLFLGNSEILEEVYYFDYLGIGYDTKLTWKQHSEKAASILKQAAAAVIRCKQRTGGQSLNSLLHVYRAKAVTAAAYGAEIWGYTGCSIFQKIENRFLRAILLLGPGTPLMALYLELVIKPIPISLP